MLEQDRTTRLRPHAPWSAIGRAALGLALSASLLAPPGTAFAQSDEDKAAARSLATQGSDALKGNRYAEALDLVTRAEALVHAPTHLLMIARAQTGLGKLVNAQETYLKLIREDLKDSAPAAFRNAQTSAKEELAAIEPKIAQLRIVLDGPGQKKAAVKMDEQAVSSALIGVFRPVDPGSHVVTALVTGLAPIKGSIDLREGEKKDIHLTVPDAPAQAPGTTPPVEPAPAPGGGPVAPAPQPIHDVSSGGFFTPMRGAGVGIGVVGIAGVAVGAIFIAKGFSSASQADELAAKNCTHNGLVCPESLKNQLSTLDSDAARQKTMGGVIFPIGAAALTTGIILIALGGPQQGGGSARIVPWFTGNAAGLRGEF